MTDFARTVDLLGRAGLRVQSLDLSTVTWWLDHGYSPERIVHKIYSVPADVLADILAEEQLEFEASVRMQVPVA